MSKARFTTEQQGSLTVRSSYGSAMTLESRGSELKSLSCYKQYKTSRTLSQDNAEMISS